MDVFQKGARQVGPQSDKDLASDLYSMLGDLYHMQKMDAKAYAAYDSALVYKPDNIGALNNYAYYLSLERKNLDKAEEMSYRTIRMEPENNVYLDTYAWVLYKLGRYDEALSYIEQAIATDPEPSDVLYEHAGDILLQLGDKAKARHYWSEALGLQRQAGTTDKQLEKKLKQLK